MYYKIYNLSYSIVCSNKTKFLLSFYFFIGGPQICYPLIPKANNEL